MAYDSAGFVQVEAVHQALRRDERFAVLVGGASVGVLAGIGAALALGRASSWFLLAVAPFFVLAAYLAVATFRDSVERGAIGCSIAAGVVALSLLAWPAMALIFPVSMMQFWIAPVATLGAMILLASCWNGAQGAMYRLSGEAASICVVVGFVGLTHLMS